MDAVIAACRLPARLTEQEAVATLTSLRAELARLTAGEPVCVDASALLHFDSSALALLLDLRRTALARGHGFSVSGLPRRLHELARLYGIAELV
ncbi:MAG: hypothetical protein RJA44_375 [Pseudomonadota bacterium]|jgi:phospholipid transport system transporter-binding protein